MGIKLNVLKATTADPSNLRSLVNYVTFIANKYYILLANVVTDGTNVALYNVSGVGSTGWVQFDEVRLYEITQTEYTAIDSMTEAQIAAKYPM